MTAKLKLLINKVGKRELLKKDLEDHMSYKGAMELAGATVHYMNSFNDYHGSWWAKVTYKGKTGWVCGSYGSCSGCDAFQGEFDTWMDDDTDLEDLKSRLIDFGEQYLDDIKTQEQAEKEVSEKDFEWDLDAKEVYEYIRNNHI
jgi:hypothetical protein